MAIGRFPIYIDIIMLAPLQAVGVQVKIDRIYLLRT